MASAQVLRKQEHLEAGKRKLEEFRKKKAAERAKKATSTGHVHTSEAESNEKQHLEAEHSRLIDSDVAGTSDSVGTALSEPSGIVINNESKETDTSLKSSFNFPHKSSADNLHSANHFDTNSSVPVESRLTNEELEGDGALQFSEQSNINYISGKKPAGGASESALAVIATNQHSAPYLPSRSSFGSSRETNYDAMNGILSNNNDSYLRDLPAIDSGRSDAVYTNGSPDNSGSVLQHDKFDYGDRLGNSSTSPFYEDSMHSAGSSTKHFPEVGETVVALESNDSTVPGLWESKFSNSPLMASASNSSPWSADSSYTGLNSSNYGQMPVSSLGTNTRRSRPSFLDSINISKGSLASAPLSGAIKVEPFNSKVFPEDNLGLSISQNSVNSIVASGNGIDQFEKVMGKNTEGRQDSYSRKQDEEFAALEQHIEDLTQEKFSLQRAIEASRTLAESLAAENSALTDSYNQQGSIINQLKSDMGKFQEEMKANLVELEAVKIEYANAQLECNAADERAKLLASEVIGLEEKALRLRSNELKLERQLEESQAEISSFKKRMSSHEKERQDLQSTIDALREEKKLLQSKVRKASAIGKFADVSTSPTNKKDVSTSTKDLGKTDDAESRMAISDVDGSLRNDVSSHPILQENGEFNLRDLSVTFPPDQIRMIENIKTLISELALEKEELMRALSAEASQSSKLQELNKDLTRKLEAQTQRLELLTAQSMVNDGIPSRDPESRPMHENTAYADEGDEVVERVLGWIMKLFPGGPSRRRTSKLL